MLRLYLNKVSRDKEFLRYWKDFYSENPHILPGWNTIDATMLWRISLWEILPSSNHIVQGLQMSFQSRNPSTGIDLHSYPTHDETEIEDRLTLSAASWKSWTPTRRRVTRRLTEACVARAATEDSMLGGTGWGGKGTATCAGACAGAHRLGTKARPK